TKVILASKGTKSGRRITGLRSKTTKARTHDDFWAEIVPARSHTALHPRGMHCNHFRLGKDTASHVMTPSIAVRAFVPHNDLIVPACSLQRGVVDDIQSACRGGALCATDCRIVGREGARCAYAQFVAANDREFAFILMVKF